jgi:hypothetical protein
LKSLTSSGEDSGDSPNEQSPMSLRHRASVVFHPKGSRVSQAQGITGHPIARHRGHAPLIAPLIAET